MKYTKKLICVILTLTMVLPMFTACGGSKTGETIEATVQTTPAETLPAATTAEASAAEDPGTGFFQVGQKMPDFTFTTYDGKTMSLYEVLEEKDMVLLNFWATWCGPCKNEFPGLQKAYEKYQDQVAVIALSVGVNDTDAMLEDYAKELGLTFPVGLDENGLCDRTGLDGIPVSMIIDRFGNICLMEASSQPQEAFENAFSIFTAEDYTETLVIPNMMVTKPDAEPASPEELAAALNVDGGKLTFANSDNPFVWPMTITEKDGRTVVQASNHTAPGTESCIQTTVTAKAGDAAVITFKLDNETFFEKMHIQVNGETVKTFTTNRDWITYAHTFETAGTYTVSVCYQRETYSWAENDNLWIDSIVLVSGDAAREAVKQNPTYPVSEQTQIQFVEDKGSLQYMEIYLVDQPQGETLPVVLAEGSESAWVKVQLDATMDPEALCLEELSGMAYPLATCAVEDGYLVELELMDHPALLGIYTLEPNTNIPTFTIAANMEQIQYIIDGNAKQGVACDVREAEPFVIKAGAAEQPMGDVTYTVTYTDQNGDPVPGVMCQVCDATTCQVYVSDNNGVCQFTLPAFAYEIHTLKVPEGYEGDTATVTNAPADGGELSFQLTKK